MNAVPRQLALLSCGLALYPLSMAQTIYKSVGADGRVVYGDRPPTSGHLEKTMKFADLPSSPLPAVPPATTATGSNAGDAPVAAPASGGVTLYSAAWCGYCRQAKAWLANKGVAYQDIDVDTPTGRAALARTGARRGIPVLVVDNRAITGFTAQAYDAALAGHK